jgi:hypothetical protein
VRATGVGGLRRRLRLGLRLLLLGGGGSRARGARLVRDGCGRVRIRHLFPAHVRRRALARDWGAAL